MSLTDKIKPLQGLIGLLVAAVSMVFAAYVYLDTRHAPRTHVEEVELRLDHKILSDRRNNLQEQEFYLEQQIQAVEAIPDGSGETQSEILFRKKKIQEEAESIDKKLDRIEQKALERGKVFAE